jgi:hypothetical protein
MKRYKVGPNRALPQPAADLSPQWIPPTGLTVPRANRPPYWHWPPCPESILHVAVPQHHQAGQLWVKGSGQGSCDTKKVSDCLSKSRGKLGGTVTSNDVGHTMGTTQAEKKATVMDDTGTTFDQRVV